MRVLPKKLIVFGLDIKVKVEACESGDLGGYDLDTKTITIDPSQNQKDKLHTLIHEMVHVVLFRTGTMQAINSELAETICENIATATLENFKLVKRN